MLTALFDYDLPEHFIAQQPAEPTRQQSFARVTACYRRDRTSHLS